jgi:ADP-ribose pyrophosphatase YjhB (NUDIX family)
MRKIPVNIQGLLENKWDPRKGKNMNFCSNCGHKVTVRIPPDDDLPRHICDKCNTVHYQNPKLVVGCIPEWEDQILLCRRAIEPRHGKWTLPAGFLENGETVADGARRETIEEAQANVDGLTPYALFDITHVNQIYFMFRSRLLDLNFGPGKESLDVRLYAEHEIPWDEIAFPVIRETLKLYFQDKKSGRFRFHLGEIKPQPLLKL